PTTVLPAPRNPAQLHSSPARRSSDLTGNVDLSGLTSLNANLNAMGIGVTTASDATGTLRLPASVTISANSITVGAGVTSGGTLYVRRSTHLNSSQPFTSYPVFSGDLL